VRAFEKLLDCRIVREFGGNLADFAAHAKSGCEKSGARKERRFIRRRQP